MAEPSGVAGGPPAALPRRDIALFFAAALLLATANLGGPSLAPLDDCFYAQKALEMSARPGMSVTWGDRPAFQNPPGQIWIMAASFGVFGANDFAARLPAALMAVGVLALTAWIGGALVGPAAGLGGAALLLSAPLFLNNARRAMLEMPTLFWTVLALAAVVAWRRRPRWILLLAPALAMAILTKSVLGLVPLLIALAAAVFLPEWRPLGRDRRFAFAAALGLALGASWMLHQWRNHDAEFVGVHFGREIAGRSLESLPFARRLLGYPAILLAQFQPVVLLAIPGAWSVAHRVGGAARLLLVWAALPLAVASLSAAQSSHYVFAIFPALALLGAAWLDARWPRAFRLYTARILPALTLAGAVLLWVRPQVMTRDVNRAFREAAPVIAARLPAGSEIAFFGADYWRVANPLLWYDRLRLARSADTPGEALARARDSGGLLLVDRERLDSLPADLRRSRRWIETPRHLLIEVPVR